MKAGIHPQYFPKASITCLCGAHYDVGSTMESINVDICAKCHPFYTGTQKLVDSARRVEKFQARVGAQATVGATRKGKAVKQAVRAAKKAEATPKADE